MPHVQGSARLQDNASGEVFDVQPADLDWESNSDQRDMGLEHIHTATVEFETAAGKPVACSWTISEYPVGAENYKSTDPAKGVQVLADFQISI